MQHTTQDMLGEKKRARRGGVDLSRGGKSSNKRRDFQGRSDRMIELVFAEGPIYNAEDFRHRFRMNKRLFLRILDRVQATDRYCDQRPDCKGDLGIHPLMKVTAARQVLANADSADALKKT
jgi:hypothetical protein